MATLVINGPARLSGKVKISGSKNAALPIIAATILTKGKNVLKNVPNITDIHDLLEIVEKLGAKINFSGNTLEIDNTSINGNDPDPNLVRNIRASILLIGPLLARNNKVNISAPGGCFIGNRPLDDIFDLFEQFGAEIREEKDIYHFTAPHLEGKEITLRHMSVTATENAVMTAVLAKGKTVLRLAACEPHVQDLCRFLNKMGARISGIGTNELTITGVENLKPCEYSIVSDEIEAATYMVAAAATSSEITLENIETSTVEYSIFSKFREANVELEIKKNSITVKKSYGIKSVKKLWTAPCPHFPTDLQAPFAILMTQANGSTLIHETMFEGRLNYIKEIKKMGANATILDPHRAVIIGPTPLFGKRITTLDLRAGATLIIAALVAKGESVISQAEIIDRGYEGIVEKLQSLGADIKRG
ncbi:MAG: UDP-N-acetylglucosamine 1-carboxyvinyltransferase [bacterium]|nr:UDP-N-acetylglucosamine 1-carboxyvinyltransferase [bacterium]